MKIDHGKLTFGLLGLGALVAIAATPHKARAETIIDNDVTLNDDEQIRDDIISIGKTADGKLTINGPGAGIEAENELNFGAGGVKGELILRDGGVAFADVAHIGIDIDGEGNIDIAGKGSRVEVTSTVYVAAGGMSKGSLKISAGGHARIGTLHIGDRGEGSATITGKESELVVTDTLYIGTYLGAVGTMTVEAGGTVFSKRAVIAEAGTGKVVVSGEDSSWTVEEELLLGTIIGEGTLEIEKGGQVSVGTVTIGENGPGHGRILVGKGSGGVLAVGQIWRREDPATAELVIDDGTIRMLGDQDELFAGMEDDDVQIGPGGATFDTQGFDVTTVAQINGEGALTKTGAGKLTFGELATYEGETRIAEGTLAAGKANVLSAASVHRILARGTLLLNGFDQTVASLENGGAIDFGGTTPGTTLTVSESYTGENGVIRFMTELGDDASATDRLVVEGDTRGQTTIRVTNVGGLGAQTVGGIKLIDIAGDSGGIFALAGDYIHEGQQAVVAGAYAYMFYKGSDPLQNDDDWFLRSERIDGDTSYQVGVAGYESYTQILLGLNGLPTLEQRVGNRFWSADGDAVWGRLEGAHDRMNPDSSTAGADYRADRFKMQAGLDTLLADNEAGRLIGGLNILYMRGDADVFSPHGDGDIGTDGYGLGATLTWYDGTGFYVDGQAQAAWYVSDLTGEPSDSKAISLASGNDAVGYALSLESGKRIALGGAWSATPQAQLSYSAVKFDGFTDVFDAEVSAGDHDSLKGRLGVAFDRDSAWTDEAGAGIRTKAYGIANLYYEFLDGTSIDVSGTPFDSRNDRLWGGLGLGGSYSWADDAYVVYGEALADTSLADFAGSYSLQASLGLRMNW